MQPSVCACECVTWRISNNSSVLSAACGAVIFAFVELLCILSTDSEMMDCP